jgi:hypothetical protein
MDLSDLMHQQHRAELGLLSVTLQQAGFSTEFLSAGDELPVGALVVDLGADEHDRPHLMTISIMPFGDDQFGATQFFQFYTALPFSPARAQMGDLGQAIAIVNGAMAIGHFGVRRGELFYRYMLAIDSSTTIGSEMLIELMSLLTFHQEHFGDYLEGVLDGQISLAILPKLIEQTDP